ncbi:MULTISPECIES: class I SAM-dependent methyltransferase [Mycobacterium]|uniref:Methyltransferase type 11 n=1 Tax=Mycobacterium gordonae TaxID=1778 RepID=A0A1X1X049_MYCGO|nr:MULTISPECIES: class I SAM-dependent methyltransferase [Mycobacterium]MBX9983558.1 class I SAM-dependent methyltransferase [Mycobacterium gordonae]MCV7009007.1 class I SAM-dependent methyltransferase [Mycobacterium gordonae]ODR23027.1 methyltransferase type 11 [Mycobacterium gordonae]ORV92244.1 methyltransferase type 11 [Mycobacterium gordonae]PJE00535.1 MAG: class I SAM-dependent methyltransferase [Mycobacterium sp.]
MPTMSRIESAFCRSAPWRVFARRIVVPWALQGLKPTGNVLEIGAGSGDMAAQILSIYPDIHITVTDFDDAMVAAARRRLAPFGSRATAQQADANALPFGDNTFDTVLTFIMLHHTVAWEQVLAEAVRVLNVGGTLIGYDLLSVGPSRILHRLEGAPHRLIRRGELQPVLDRLPLADVQLRHNPLLARFSATKRSRA